MWAIPQRPYCYDVGFCKAVASYFISITIAMQVSFNILTTVPSCYKVRKYNTEPLFEINPVTCK